MRLAGVPSSQFVATSVDRDGVPLRLAVYGAGKAARFHLDAIARLAGVEVCGIYSPSGTSAAALAEHHPGAIHTADPATLLREEPDAALVAVPAAAAPELATSLVQRRTPVLLEKPAATTASRARQLADLAQQHATLVSVAVNRRYYSLVLQALAAVRERGPVRAVLVEGHEPVAMLMRSGNVDSATARQWQVLNSVHFIDLLRLVGGEVTEVHTTSQRLDVGSWQVSASVSFDSGTVGTYLASWNSASPPAMRIFGDEVTAEVQLGQPESAFLRFAGGRRVKLHPDDSDRLAKPGVLDQDAAFLRAVSDGRDRLPFPASDLADHARSLALAESVFAESAQPPGVDAPTTPV